MKRTAFAVLALMIAAGLAACGKTSTPVIPTAVPADTATPAPTPTATVPPPRTLVVCLSEEPQSLYVYGSNSRSMWNVLEAVYDGPVDTRGYTAQPVLLEKIPALADGDAALQPVAVQAGDPVVDANDRLVALARGTRVLPAGCGDLSCAVEWDGVTALQMDRLSVTFRLKAGITWSDGAPLTAADSVYSYTLASDPATPNVKTLVDRTDSYTAGDDLSVTWSGVPGFYAPDFASLFFLPLPKHAYQSISAADLLTNETATRSPLGWGPYVIEEWKAGDHITLSRNRAYFRAAEGLPRFDTLVYRFLGNPADSALMALVAGECDVVDQNPGFLRQIEELINTQNNGKLQLLLANGPQWEHIDFGVRPASYDDGQDPAQGDRPDFFGDPRVRQGIAQCIDRAGIVKEVFHNRGQVPAGLLPPDHPLAAADLPSYPYDPAAGAKLLEDAGWKDADGNPATPRVASGVRGVPDGTPLALSYRTSNAELRLLVSEKIAKNLTDCGVGVQRELLGVTELFAPGPDGPLFGRRFDLAQFTWDTGGVQACRVYSSDQIPSADNLWTGMNIAGFANPEYDAACAAAVRNPTDSAAAQKVERLFAQELPALPLYWQLRIAIARPDLCGAVLDPSARSLLPNLEELDFPCR